jgi:hypothetical protein
MRLRTGTGLVTANSQKAECKYVMQYSNWLWCHDVSRHVGIVYIINGRTEYE